MDDATKRENIGEKKVSEFGALRNYNIEFCWSGSQQHKDGRNCQ